MQYNKYNNKKTVVDGIVFDSKREAKRWQELKVLERAGEITDLERQVKFELIPKQKGERSCSYTADFVYIEQGERVVEDSKGHKTRDYVIKRKLMLQVHGVRIQEV
ncbi:MAG: DUF1064 domain-containing protein [Clostridiales bacterium]|nr:DUF1064 domain-containing protein [Clostridiales bacterium]